MIKPAGPACNLACAYCFYLEKAALYPGKPTRMEDATLECVVAAYLGAHPGPKVTFAWQGGEPLLMGLDFFKRVIALQRQYARPDQRIENALQTNGILIDDHWAEFLAEHRFLVGISIDGPAELHDQYRRDRGGHPSHTRVLNAIRTLQRHEVAPNALATVNNVNVAHPLRIYRFLTGLGIEHLQFIPIVEAEKRGTRKVMPFTVRPEQCGHFLCTIFGEWSLNEVGKIFIQWFESALNVWLGGSPTLCIFAPTCGRAMAIEHNGDLYACDHFVYRDCLRGNFTPDTAKNLVDGYAQSTFGAAKADLSGQCRNCPVLRFCGGDCPKHRLHLGKDGKLLSYLCPALKAFFTHSAPVLQAMAGEIRAGRPASNVMAVLQELRR